ncbi:MAG: MBL fold metallo-hydrolase [Solobacterium sp.]|nr:MBL fold metallo-hydrolase [Solobacterium sp.]
MLLRYTMIASGSKGNCFVIEDRDTVLLIDCGSTRKHIAQSFEKIALDKERINAVLITHDHSDHVSQIRHFRGKEIWSPVPLPDIPARQVIPHRPFMIGCLKITALALSHDAPNTVGYVIEDGEEKLVYITDTGYVNNAYLKFISDADYIVMESNHDIEMLMATRRPQYLKARIYSDQGHLCNEDCAALLSRIVTERTKMIILAHISQEANTREKALEATCRVLLSEKKGQLNRDLVVCAAGQYEMIRKGSTNEEMELGTVYRSVGLESYSQLRLF